MTPVLVVLDTNVIISAVMFGGIPRRILEAALQGQFRIALSRPLLEELIGVLEGPKFRLPEDATQLLADELVAISTIVHPRKRLTVIRRDPDDNRVLECALTAQAKYIVTGDDDLLSVAKYRTVAIINPQQFLNEVLTAR